MYVGLMLDCTNFHFPRNNRVWITEYGKISGNFLIWVTGDVFSEKYKYINKK